MDTKQIMQLIADQKDRFVQLDSANGSLLSFQQECLFARQQILKTDFAINTAAGNPQSVQSAILNVAAIGLSLNPANKHAYLVPRDKAIHLDISFLGLIKIATDSGAIKWAKAEIVYKNDTFKWRGPSEAPLHEADPFGERGDIRGLYCIAKLPDGSVMTEVMSKDEIDKVRDVSKAKNNGPWVTWYEEMAKKTIIKRAYKSWPQTPNRARIDQAVAVLHETEGTAYSIEEQAEYLERLRSQDALSFWILRLQIGDDKWQALYNGFEAGKKVAMKKEAGELEKQGAAVFKNVVSELNDLAGRNDRDGIEEILAPLKYEDQVVILDALKNESRHIIENMGIEAAA